jgi:hypothetical protein
VGRHRISSGWEALNEGAILMPVADCARRRRDPLAIGILAVIAITTLGCGNDGSSTHDPIDSSSAVSTRAAKGITTTAITATGSVPGSTLSVDGVLRTGEEFEVSFTGELRELRGGYLWVQRVDDAPVALLRSDGNPEIPMGYAVDATEFEMLDDGLSGATSRFLLPPDLAAGRYKLCTANSVPDICVEVEIHAG